MLHLGKRRENGEAAHDNRENAEGQLKSRAFQIVGVFAADPRSQSEQNADDGGGAPVHVAALAVFDDRTQTQWRQQNRKAGSGRFVLGKSGDVDKRRHDDESAADAEKARRDARHKSGQQQFENKHARTRAIEVP